MISRRRCLCFLLSLFTTTLLAAGHARAQSGTNQQYFEDPGVYLYVEVDVDDQYDLYSFASVSLDYGSELEAISGLDIYLTLSGSDGFYDYDEETGLTYVETELYGNGSAGSSYTADGGAAACDFEDEFPEVNCTQDPAYQVGDIQAFVQATYDPSDQPPTVNQQTEYVTIDENNQQITLTGSYLLNSDGSAPTLTVGPPSDDTTITVNSATDTQVVATLNVANGSYPSLSSINLTTDNGEDGPDLYVGYPDASNIQVVPSTWPAGQSTPVTITGDNIGTSPTISISPGDITYSFTPSSGGGVTGTVNVPASETATEAIVTIVPGAQLACGGSCWMSNDPGDPTGQGTAVVGITAPVAPGLTLSTPLWFFGAGNTPDPTFTQGGTQATVTATDASGGTFDWSVANGADKVSFASSSSEPTATTTSNTVTVYTVGRSSSDQDVTIELQWTPAGAITYLDSTLTTGVDSPYQLMPNGPVADSPASYVGGECVKNFNYIPEGWESDVPYIILSRFGAQLSHVYINETFGTFIPDYVGNNWTPPTPGQYLSIDGTFFDDMCSVTAGYSLTPTTQIPQTPLGNVAIDHANQNWYVGSPTLGSGVQVQTNAFQRYQDHGRHTNVTSPTP